MGCVVNDCEGELRELRVSCVLLPAEVRLSDAFGRGRRSFALYTFLYLCKEARLSQCLSESGFVNVITTVSHSGLASRAAVWNRGCEESVRELVDGFCHRRNRIQQSQICCQGLVSTSWIRFRRTWIVKRGFRCASRDKAACSDDKTECQRASQRPVDGSKAKGGQALLCCPRKQRSSNAKRRDALRMS